MIKGQFSTVRFQQELDGHLLLAQSAIIHMIPQHHPLGERGKYTTLIRTDEGKALLDAITLKADILPQPGPVPAYTRNPKDDKFLACALVGDANYLITEDGDMLVLEAMGDVRLVTPYDFLRATRR